MEYSINFQELAIVLEQLLTMSPSKAGKRLCSERELAKRLNLDRMKVQKSFDLLVEKGILARRHGSGTYVRKVPRSSGEAVPIKLENRLLGAHDLFAEPSSTPLRRQIRREHRKLRLALLPNENWHSESNNLVFAGIRDRIRQEGHDLEVHTGNTRDRVGAAHLVDELQKDPADGYILWTPYLPVLNKAFHGKNPPAVFIGAQAREIDLECAPIVRIDLEDALVRGVRKLAAQGHHRIALIGLASIERVGGVDRIIYDETMSKLGLPYRSAVFCPLDDKAAAKSIREMFEGPLCPDAVYVSDDIVLRHILPTWIALGLIPGENLAVISLSIRGHPLPELYDWSRIEFHPFQVGRMAVDSLLQEIETAGEAICSFEHLGVWIPGKTHLLAKERAAARGIALAACAS